MFLKTKLSAPKKEVKQNKGVQSAAVRAFLQKQEDETKRKGKYQLGGGGGGDDEFMS